MRNDIEFIIPDEIKGNITQKEIDIVTKELEEHPRYNIVKYACVYKEHHMFLITWKNKPKYCGASLFISVDKEGRTEWIQDFDSWCFFIDEARKQAPSVFPPFK